MKNIGWSVIFMLFFLESGICFAETVSESVDMSVSPVPALVQVIGTGPVSASATRYPEFIDYQGSNSSCGEKLKKRTNQREAMKED